MKKLFLIAALAGSTVALPAAAASSYNVVTDFGNPVFSYGFGSGATGFQAATFNNNCFGNAALTCYANDPNGVPTVLKNNSATPQSIGTPTAMPNMLLLHPGFDSASDAVLRFTAPTGGQYQLNGGFLRLDTSSGSGNGVNVSIFSIDNGVTNTLFSGAIGSSNYNALMFSSSVALGANGQIVFAVNNAGDVSFDSTGLRATISAVPEPATWGMMVLGFGMMGFGVRRGAKKQVRVTYA